MCHFFVTDTGLAHMRREEPWAKGVWSPVLPTRSGWRRFSSPAWPTMKRPPGLAWPRGYSLHILLQATLFFA